MTGDALEVYRSARRADCEERAFVLLAVGVPSEIVREDAAAEAAPQGEGARVPGMRARGSYGAGGRPGGRGEDREPCAGGSGDREAGQYVLLVASDAHAAARAHLLRYEEERRLPAAAPAMPPQRLHAHAWVGCLLYSAVLLGVAYAVGDGLWRLDAFDVGDLYAAAVRQGEWWRAWTALTLHLDPAHIAANLGAGVWFGWLAGRLLGPGVAWALIVNGAAGANLLEGLLAAPDDRSAGASTAVFTALGLLAAYSWRERRHLPQRRVLAWSPLIAGVVLLGWLGTAGEHTDVFAHLAGFVVGALLGAAAAIPRMRRALERTPQWLAGAIALGSVALAWTWALRS